MIDFDSDLLEMLKTDEFASDVSMLAPINQTVVGIFDSEHLELSGDGTTEYSTYDPQVQIRTVDENGIVQTNTVQINGITYTVADIRPDGTGVTTLILNKA